MDQPVPIALQQPSRLLVHDVEVEEKAFPSAGDRVLSEVNHGISNLTLPWTLLPSAFGNGHIYLAIFVVDGQCFLFISILNVLHPHTYVCIHMYFRCYVLHACMS